MSSYSYDSTNDTLSLLAGTPRSRLNAIEADIASLNASLNTLTVNTFGTAVNLTSGYGSNPYTPQYDGYLYMVTTQVTTSAYVQAELRDSTDNNSKAVNIRIVGNGAQIGVGSIFVKKGMKIRITGSGTGSANFYPLSN